MESCQMCTKWIDEPELRIAEFDFCYAMLNRDQFFPGYSLVVSKRHVTELFHLDRDTRGAIIEEVNGVASALYLLFQPAKINYELLGNMVPHMHWHLIPRFTTESLWPRPIWSEPHSEHILTAEEYAQRIGMIRKHLP